MRKQFFLQFFVCLLSLRTSTSHATITVVCNLQETQIQHALPYLKESLAQVGDTMVVADLSPQSIEQADIVITTDVSQAKRLGLPSLPSIQKEGFSLVRIHARNDPFCVLALDSTGAMYGIMELAEQIRMQGSLQAVPDRSLNPRFSFRAIKFNLPWSPYRSASPTEVHLSICRDIQFWERFLNQMVENRFNALTLWNLHPFPFLFRPKNYPEACPFNDRELHQWKTFWKTLFRMAKERGIETYLVNWNIVVSPEFAKAYGVKERNDTSALVKQYTKECVTQLINEYDDLSGLGVTLADWMNNMTPKEREDWIEDTFVAGMKEAKRPIKFIHRSVLAGSPLEMRRVIDHADLPDPVWVEVKFNWSHGHSTPRLAITHDYNTGKIDERFWKPAPDNYKIAWMIRNEDFFILRWGVQDFIRKHIAQNGEAYVDGYFVGSEGYIPAMDYSHIESPHRTWQYAFEKQWLFYAAWGRLLYHPETPDAVFASMFDQRYGTGTGESLLAAYSHACKMPLRLASFYASTWDYTLYSEGFLSPARARGISDKVSPFISIQELIDHETLDPTFLSIADYVKKLNQKETIADEMTTPLELADESERDGLLALQKVDSVVPFVNSYSGALECEILDIKAWSYLSLYFAEKLRAGVALEIYRQTGDTKSKEKAVTHLEKALHEWDQLIEVTRQHYHPTPHVALSMRQWREYKPPSNEPWLFSWEGLRDQVVRDIDLARNTKPHQP